MESKPARMARDKGPSGSFITNGPDEPRELSHSRAKELRDLAFITLELFDFPVEQKLAEIEYNMTLRRLTFRHRLNEAIELAYPWFIISAYVLLALRLSARQQPLRHAGADLVEHKPSSRH